MPMQYIEIGGSPASEPCAQTGASTYDFVEANRLECRAYIAGLRLKYGPPPEGGRFQVKGNPHDFGTYYEVRFIYPEDSPDGRAYADKVENGLATWAEVGMWAPVVYDDKGNFVHMIKDEELWMRDFNPGAHPTREAMAAQSA